MQRHVGGRHYSLRKNDERSVVIIFDLGYLAILHCV
jgi:hypothetical protein